MNTRDIENKGGGTDFESVCRGFQRMFEEMTKCCPDKGSFTDCSPMIEGMMKEMMQMCCRPKAGDTKQDCTRC